MIKEEKIGGRCKYEVEHDLRSLTEADKIKADSKRMNAVGLLAAANKKSLSKYAKKQKKGF